MLLLLTTTILSSLAETAPAIDTVVLLMFENRAFDHMMGFFPGVNGLKGNEFNLVNTSDPNSQKIYVNNSSPYIGPIDPNHNTPATTGKIFGQQCLSKSGQFCVPLMDGFVEYEVEHQHHTIEQAATTMNMFTPSRLPVLYKLATEFALFDRFFASVPGPTWPNRLFQLMGSSKGDTETSCYGEKGCWHNNTGLYFGKTIFDTVEAAGKDWAFYYGDAPLEFAMIEKLASSPEKMRGWRQFKRDARGGTLPAFSWINPSWFVNVTTGEGANDQHPDHDVRLGEALLKEMYEDLRASPKWNSTLFIVTYDEHGGFYDHVPPPMQVPKPDDLPSFPDTDFNFTRLGMRIPALLISPLIPKGTVISSPTDAEKPFANSEFELSSVIASVKNIFQSPEPHLTKRDAWAATFDTRLSERTPRTDCPMLMPDAPKSLGEGHAHTEAMQPMNHLQQDIIRAYAHLRGLDLDAMEGGRPRLQGEGAEWISKVVADIF